MAKNKPLVFIGKIAVLGGADRRIVHIPKEHREKADTFRDKAIKITIEEIEL